jgi:anti-sigma B factor antagonist
MSDSNPPSAAASDSAAHPLDVSVAAGESAVVVSLSGEADLTTLDQLNKALDAHLHNGTQLLTVDLSRLRFADSATVAALVRAARTLRARGMRLELWHPQPAVARVLELTGVDQVLTVRREPTAERSPAELIKRRISKTPVYLQPR